MTEKRRAGEQVAAACETVRTIVGTVLRALLPRRLQRLAANWRPILWCIVGFGLMAAAGQGVGDWAARQADASDPWGHGDGAGCGLPAPDGAPSAPAMVGGLPGRIDLDFGYGRGRRVTDNQTVTVGALQSADDTATDTDDATRLAPDGAAPALDLPERLPLELLGLQRVGGGPTLRDASVVAVRIGDTATYRLQVCVDLPDDAQAGEYSGTIVMTSANLTADGGSVVVVRVQSRFVPHMLFMGLPIIVPLGVLYTALLMVRRVRPDLRLSEHKLVVHHAFKTWNGWAAVLAAVIACYPVWLASCLKNPVWGASLFEFLTTGGTLIAATAGAATLPLGLASDAGAEAPRPAEAPRVSPALAKQAGLPGNGADGVPAAQATGTGAPPALAEA